MTVAGISAAKRRYLVGRCHSDTSHLNSVQAQIARVPIIHILDMVVGICFILAAATLESRQQH